MSDLRIRNYTFCHIPKTGGLSIGSMLYNHKIEHRVCVKSKINNFLFTFIRNPYDRCISAFEYLKAGGINKKDKKDAIKYIGNYNFNDFVRYKLELASSKQTHFRPQNYWIPEGADFIGKYENFEKDINKLRQIIYMLDIDIPHKNKTYYNNTYFYLLDSETKNIIYNIQKRFYLIWL